jgi:hypothetical protein
MVKRGGPNGLPYNPPWPLAPQPFRPLFDCCVVVVWDQAVRLHLATWSQNCCALNPTQPKKKTKIPLIKRSGHTIPHPFHPPPPRMLVDCGVLLDWHLVVRSNSPAWSQIATSILPPPAQKFD